jgi:hypothetical protein
MPSPAAKGQSGEDAHMSTYDAFHSPALAVLTASLKSMSLQGLAKAGPAPSSADGCLSHGWSIVTTASATSQLCGVLAGLVFTSVTILISRSGRRNTQALGLLSCAFVVLALASYLFALVFGSASNQNCARVWAEAVPTSGLLTVGGLAVATSIGWLVSAREEAETEDGQQSRERPARDIIDLYTLARFIAHTVAVVVALLLASTVLDYGNIAFSGHATTVVTWVAFLSPVAVAIASLSLSLYRYNQPDSTPSMKISLLSFRCASYGILAQAAVSTVFVGYITNHSANHSVVAVIAVILGLITPSALLVALVQSVAPATRARPAQADAGITEASASSSTAPDAAPA